MGDRDMVIGEQYCEEALRMIEAARQLSSARNVERIAEIVRHGARELCGADGATFILREGDQCYYADEEAIAPLWKGKRFPAEICISGWTMKHAQAVAIEDVYTDPRVPIDAFRPTFVKSMLMAPMIGNSPLGAIGNYWAQTHRPSEQEVYLLQTLANIAAVALENVRLCSGLETYVKERTAVLENEVAERLRVQGELEENRARLAAILERLGEGVVVFDLAGQVLNMNPAALKLHGFTDVAQARRRLPEFADNFELRSLAGTLVPLAEWPLARVLRHESFTDAEFEVRNKRSGETTLLSYSGTPVRDPRGEVLLGVLAIRDIGERKRTERALREREELLRVTFEQAAVGICHIGHDGRFLRANRKFSEMLGYTEDELRCMHFLDITCPTDREVGLAEFKRCMAGEIGSFTVEKRYQRRDASVLWGRLTASPVRDGNLAAVRFTVAIVEDITERKQGEAAIQRLNAELEERVRQRTAELQSANEALLHSNMELQRFAHATAHDLQTPLRSIAGFVQLLEREIDGCEGGRVKEWSALVIDNTRRLQTLIDDLLDYTRLDAQGLPFEPVDLRAVFDQVCAALAVLIRETGAELHCGRLPTLPVERLQLAQLLQNLLENGIKYNRSKPPRVSVACEFQDDQWLFSVADNGIGIDPRHHERIFEVFRRLHTYSQVPGSGIGLALCRRIVERHGGRIWVESRPGEGSTFYFTLPDRGSQMLNRAP